MTDPADLRPGQRVRLTIEGTVELHPNNSSYLILAGVMVGDYLNLMGPHQAPHTALRMAATIEVLAEPRPDEPTGLGAVVEASSVRHPDNRRKYVHTRTWDGLCWSSEKGTVPWSDLLDPITVLSPGWEPTDG